MKHLKLNKLLIISIILILSLGCYTPSSLAKYSELQTKTIEQASKKTAIFPSKYGLDVEKETPKKTEKEEISKALGKMIRALFLAIALFFGFIAVLVKYKTGSLNPGEILSKFKHQKQVQQSSPTNTETESEKIDKVPVTEEELQDKRVKDLVFKFFEMNK